MERVRNQATPLRYLAFFTALAILTTGANRGAFGEQSDNATKPTSTDREPSAGSNSDKTTKPISTNRDPSAGSNVAQARMVAQAPLLTAVERIRELDPKGTGLGGIQLQVDKHTLEVWWKGDPPAAVRKEIARQERNSGIKVLLRPAKYSQRELIEATRGIMLKATAYPGLVSAGPLVDGSGLEIGVTDTERAASFKFPVPVQVVVRKGIVPLISRGADTEPWWGGAVTRAAVGNQGTCSTGFAMTQQTSIFARRTGILTAEHCFCGGGVPFNNGVGIPIGVAEPASAKQLFTDSLFIPTNAAPAIYDGGVGSGEFSKPVVGTENNVVSGMFVCTSGAATGAHCTNLKIDPITNMGTFNPNQDFCPPSEPFREGVSTATQVDGAVAAGSGDSGGPVFTLGTDPSTVKAAGIIWGGLDVVDCQGPGSVCFNRVAFTDVYSLRSSHNAEVLVDPNPGPAPTPSPAPTSGGGATISSMLVFGWATLLWTLFQLRRRAGSRPEGLCS
jgi:hypothetical protein